VTARRGALLAPALLVACLGVDPAAEPRAAPPPAAATGENRSPDPAPAPVLERELAGIRATLKEAQAGAQAVRQRAAAVEAELAAARGEAPAPLRTLTDLGRPGSPALTQEGVEVLSARATAIEKDATWWRFDWQVELRNLDAEPRAVELVLRFLDRDGLAVDADREQLSLAPRELRTARDSYLLPASLAPTVASVQAVIEE
jgi:hypothetical protein